jgi:hypothetical protein
MLHAVEHSIVVEDVGEDPTDDLSSVRDCGGSGPPKACPWS